MSERHLQNPGSGKITFSNVVTVDASCAAEYPIILKKPLYIKLHVDNQQAALTAPNVLMSVTVSFKSFPDVSLRFADRRVQPGLVEQVLVVRRADVRTTVSAMISHFSLNDSPDSTNMDACSSGIPCPVAAGASDITVTLDFTKFGVSF